MTLFRVFDWDGVTMSRRPGGPLFVGRDRQGTGRHDAPALYGAWYCSRLGVAAVAECLQVFRGHRVRDEDFTRSGGLAKALVALDVDGNLRVTDLDDPGELVQRRMRLSQVASMQRPVTQAMAVALYREGASGVGWWSTLRADWPHVTLFHERALRHVAVHTAPQYLSVTLPVVREAADYLGIRV